MKRIKSKELLFELNEKDFTASVIGCFSIDSRITIPRSIKYQGQNYIITSIGKGSFQNNNYILTIEFSENSEIRSICKGAFTDSQLINLLIPPKLTKLEEGWCKSTLNLAHISLSPHNQHYRYQNDEFLLGKSDPKSDTFDTLLFCCRSIEKAVIPSTIKYISSFCFSECSSLQSIEFSENSGLVSIGKYAFSDTSIKEISIPFCVKNIGKCCFYGCSNLEYVNFSKNSKLQIIEKGTFSFSSLKRIEIPSNVTEIKEKAFERCKSLESVDFSENSEIISIGQNAFVSTKITSFFFPQKLKTLEIGWCNSVKKLKNIFVSSKNQSFSSYGNDFILAKSDKISSEHDTIIFANRSIQKVFIPSFIKRIDSFAFSDCCDLQSIEFAENSHLKSIGEFAFYSASFPEINVPSSVEKIENGAFSNCEELKSINFSEDSKLRLIDDGAFSWSSIDKIHFPSKLEDLGSMWCDSTKNLVNFSISPLNPHFLNYQNEFILGKSNKKSDKFDVIVFAKRNIEIPIIPSNIQCIGPCSFHECGQFHSIQFQSDSKLQKIDEKAFLSSSIQSITIPSSVREIGKSSFCYCFELEKVEFEKDSELELIDQMAFLESRIHTIRIPEKTKKICDGSFKYCENLRCIEILGDEICLGEGCFIDIQINSIISMPNSQKVSIHQNSFKKSVLLVNCGTKILFVDLYDHVLND